MNRELGQEGRGPLVNARDDNSIVQPRTVSEGHGSTRREWLRRGQKVSQPHFAGGVPSLEAVTIQTVYRTDANHFSAESEVA